MTPLDVALLLAGVAAALVAVIASRGVALRALLAVGAALAVLQVALKGFTWQFVPLYGLMGLLLLAAWRGGARWRLRALIALTAVASIGAWSVLAVPALPRPSGPHAVGTVTWRWVDGGRAEEATDEASDRRHVVAQAWYPSVTAKGPHSVYMDGLGRLPASVNGLPRLIFRRFDEVDTHTVVGAPASPAQPAWPVVIFSPGYGAPRAFYSSLLADLASRGFVVIALDHPYEGPAVELADGTIATPIERFLPSDPDRTAYMERRVVPRVGDVRFVIDRLVQSGGALEPLTGHMDLRRVAVIGHSFGGATAALATAGDARLAAGADLDGMLYGGVERLSLGRPFMIIESDPAVTGHTALYFERANGLLARLGAPSQHHQIKGSNHLSFSDGELFFAAPARPLVRRVMGGSRPALEVHREAADLLEAFLRLPPETPSG